MQNTLLWEKCLRKLEDDIEERDFHTWVRPLTASDDDSSLVLYAPNRFVVDWVEDNLFEVILKAAKHFGGNDITVSIKIFEDKAEGSKKSGPSSNNETNSSDSKEYDLISNDFGTNVLNLSLIHI